MLSPRDFALAREWHRAGIPLASVLAGIDRTAREASSLQSCRRAVETLAAAGVAAPDLAPPEAPAPEDLPARLQALTAALARGDRAGAFERARRRLAELVDLAAVARAPNPAYLRAALAELDALVDDAAVLALTDAERRAFEAEAVPGLGRAAGRVAPEALQDARRNHLCRRARERFALPRVGRG